MLRCGMAKMLQVRNVPDDVHSALKARATRAGMSLSEFVLRELKSLAGERSLDEIFADVEASGAHVPMDQINEIIRADRQSH